MAKEKIGFLADGKGDKSSMRLVFVIGAIFIALITVNIVVVWDIATFHGKEVDASQMINLIVAVFVPLMMGKAGQSAFENMTKGGEPDVQADGESTDTKQI
jgi:hypothetical protein